MSRLRTIKPGFFLDEELAECDPLARLLYAGLWTIADREGRLEDRPKRIKAECLPYDDGDGNVLLDQLARLRFIVRYTVDDVRYIAIPTWRKHQHPHVKEPASVIPAPDEYQLSMSLALVEPGSSCLLSLGSCLGEEHMVTADAATASVDDFDELWRPYPRKVGRAETEKRWKRLTVKDRAGAILAAAHLASYVQESNAELQYVPHPATFIGPKRTFEDWQNGVPPGYVQEASAGHKLNPIVKREVCPECETDLTYDEWRRASCPMCGYKAATP